MFVLWRKKANFNKLKDIFTAKDMRHGFKKLVELNDRIKVADSIAKDESMPFRVRREMINKRQRIARLRELAVMKTLEGGLKTNAAYTVTAAPLALGGYSLYKKYKNRNSSI